MADDLKRKDGDLPRVIVARFNLWQRLRVLLGQRVWILFKNDGSFETMIAWSSPVNLDNYCNGCSSWTNNHAVPRSEDITK